MPEIIAITGGIGSGKSVISKILRTWGYAVFDCDSEAKRIMDSDAAIKERLAIEIAKEVIEDGQINRKVLSEIVFNDKVKLEALNSIVHGAVRSEIASWAKSIDDGKPVFVETAILYSSGLYNDVDAEIRVTAPEQVRINRVIRRNGLSAQHIKARIESQKSETSPSNQLSRLFVVDNGEKSAVLPQLVQILQTL